MNINRFKLYQPNNIIASGGASILDVPFGPSWDNDPSGRSANSLFDYLKGKYGRVFFISSNYLENDYDGEVGNPLKPYGQSAVSYVINSLGQPDDTFIFLPGTYTVNTFLIPKKNQTFILINARYNCTAYNGFAIGFHSKNDIVNRAENVTFQGIGNSSINKTDTGPVWSVLAVYNYFTGTFKNLSITSYGSVGLNANFIPDHRVTFINCRLELFDSYSLFSNSGGGFICGMLEFINSEIHGLVCIGAAQLASSTGGSLYGYMLIAKNSKFIYRNAPSSNIFGNIFIFRHKNYFGNDVLIENCTFDSPFANIVSINSGYIPDWNMVVSKSDFVNGSEGWIDNRSVNTQYFKLKDSYTKNNANIVTGYPIINIYNGAGVQLEVNLQV